MRLAVYHPWVYLMGGAERTLLEMIRHSRHEWTVVTNHFEPWNTFPGYRDIPVLELPFISVRRNLRAVAHASLTLLLQRPDLRHFSALMISNEGVGNLMALHRRLPPLFCFCHTPLKIHYDPETRRRFYARPRSPAMHLGIRAFLRADRVGWRRYGRIFCNSRETLHRIVRNRLAPPDKLEVLHPGLDLDRFGMSGEREPYFLLPGRIMWTKNIELAIAAFRSFLRSYSGETRFRLIIAGMLDRKSRPYHRELVRQASGLEGVGFVLSPGDEVLTRLYRRAWAVMSTSPNEDWGLTVLEGMASGKPVLAVDQGGPRESVDHGQTGFLCPAEPEAFSRRMLQLAAEPEMAASLGRKARERAARFTWSAFAGRIDEYVEGLVP